MLKVPYPYPREEEPAPTSLDQTESGNVESVGQTSRGDYKVKGKASVCQPDLPDGIHGYKDVSVVSDGGGVPWVLGMVEGKNGSHSSVWEQAGEEGCEGVYFVKSDYRDSFSVAGTVSIGGYGMVEGIADEDGEIHVHAQILPDTKEIEEQKGKAPSPEELDQIIKDVVRQVNDKLPGFKRIRSFTVRTKAFVTTTTQKIKRDANQSK